MKSRGTGGVVIIADLVSQYFKSVLIINTTLFGKK